MQHKALSIAGFDSSGGAGLQADLKTFSAFGCYGMTVLTALPVQNTRGVRSCYEIPLQAIGEQLAAIFDDIVPDSIKIGMLFNSDIVELVSEFLRERAKNIPIVLDPVMVAKSGDTLLLPNAISALKNNLIPLATLITPNLPEAKALTDLEAHTFSDMENIAKKLLSFGSKAVLLKGGHLPGPNSKDFYCDQTDQQHWFNSPRVITNNNHGTGCTLSAAIAACLAMNMDLVTACETAKHYLYNALNAAKNEKIGKGVGPVHHFYRLWPTKNRI